MYFPGNDAATARTHAMKGATKINRGDTVLLATFGDIGRVMMVQFGPVRCLRQLQYLK